MLDSPIYCVRAYYTTIYQVGTRMPGLLTSGLLSRPEVMVDVKNPLSHWDVTNDVQVLRFVTIVLTLLFPVKE